MLLPPEDLTLVCPFPPPAAGLIPHCAPSPPDQLPHRRNDWIFYAVMIHSVKRQKVFKLFIRDEHSWASLNQNLTHLTLIGPSEVKVDLDDFNLKLYENLLSTFYIKIPIPAETSFKSY
jgi:hypothetical protein